MVAYVRPCYSWPGACSTSFSSNKRPPGLREERRVQQNDVSAGHSSHMHRGGGTRVTTCLPTVIPSTPGCCGTVPFSDCDDALPDGLALTDLSSVGWVCGRGSVRLHHSYWGMVPLVLTRSSKPGRFRSGLLSFRSPLLDREAREFSYGRIQRVMHLLSSLSHFQHPSR